MSKRTVTLHPDSYYRMETPLKLCFNTGITEVQFNKIKTSFAKLETPLLINGHEKRTGSGEWRYHLYTTGFCFGFSSFIEDDKHNFSCYGYNDSNKVKKWYNDPFAKMFLIEPACGIYLIDRVNNKTFYVETKMCKKTEYKLSDYEVPKDEHVDWGMEQSDFYKLINQMNRFFSGNNDFIPRTIGPKMKKNIMVPFEGYTDIEQNLEEEKVDGNREITFVKRIYEGIATETRTYLFYSNDENANPETNPFKIGDKISIKGNNSREMLGTLEEIDDITSEKYIIFKISFRYQFNDSEVPDTGTLTIAVNDSQQKVRKGVARSIKSGATPATYMYRTFEDFEVDGYANFEKTHGLSGSESRNVIDENSDIVSFLEELLKKKYPPNQMQMEAIIKGLLTKDMLLVLGPPGTGKTTVILSWVEYFLRHGIRVLISSQNNAAVDNVLERLDENKFEIVRLGSEQKIQEGCQQFIPAKKIKAMCESCEKNTRELNFELGKDYVKIEKYENLLNNFIDATTKYKILTANIKSVFSRLNVYFDDLIKAKNDIDEYFKLVNNLRQTRAHKVIFLQEYNRKNFIVRFVFRRHKKRVEEALELSNQRYEHLIKAVKEKVSFYNTKVKTLNLEMEQLRKNEDYLSYYQMREQVEKMNRSIFFDDYGQKEVFSLGSILGDLYKAPNFSMNAYENYDKCKAELEQLENLKDSARKLRIAVTEWEKEATNTSKRNDIFQDLLLESCQVVGATCIGINSNKRFANVDFGVSIIDESGQIQIHNALVPMSRAPKTLMLGDYKQIPPIAQEEAISACENNGIDADLLKKSFFEYLFEEMRKKEIKRIKYSFEKRHQDEDTISINQNIDMTDEEAKQKLLEPVLQGYNAKPKKDDNSISPYSRAKICEFVDAAISDKKKIVNLNSQFRMPGNISDVISEWFYEGNYFSSYNMSNFEPIVMQTTKPMVIINTAKCKNRSESQPSNGMGYKNDYEAQIIADIIESIAIKKGKQYIDKIDENVGIISAYGAQVRTIREKLKKKNVQLLEEKKIHGMVASLDSFQGQERDLIIYSLTRSSNKSKHAARIGFLKELRRLNVAFTRGKKQLVIVGDIDYLKECLYIAQKENEEKLPCFNTDDSVITQKHIVECSECSVECERKFSRFIKLLMQHATNPENSAGDVFDAEEFVEILRKEDIKC